MLDFNPKNIILLERNELALYKIQKEYWSTLKSFLIYLNTITDEELLDIETNQEVLDTLRKL